MDKLTHKLIMLLNDIIDVKFDTERVSHILNRKDNLSDILKENNLLLNKEQISDKLIEIARKRYFERLEHEQYIHSLS